MTNLFQSTSLLCNLAHTCVTCKDEVFTVIYYQTEILKYWPESGFVSLNVGKYQTASTIRRLNQAIKAIGLDARVYIRKGQCFVQLNLDEPVILQFVDGVCEFNRFTGERTV